MISNNPRAGSARSVIVSGLAAATTVTVDARWEAQPDTASRDHLRETRERVQAALHNSSMDHLR